MLIVSIASPFMKCVKCTDDISKLFKYCPSCGAPQPDEKQLIKVQINNYVQEAPPPDISDDPDGIFLHGVNLQGGIKTTTTVCNEFRGQNHFRPKDGINYWINDMYYEEPDENVHIDIHPINNNNKKLITILVPFYNEEASELMLTLNSLYDNFMSLKRHGFDIHILLVMDGWWKASESMKKKMKAFFPANGHLKPWWENIKTIKETDDLSKCVSTFIVQRVTPNSTIAQTEIDDGRKVKISLLAKRDNRKKINAHDWMLSSFAKNYKAEFVFLTDCGTLFEKDCLTLLVKELMRRPDCVAVSGRQRVMTAAQQQSEDECFIGIEASFRAAQRYDYESSLAVYVGAFSLFGMLPVIPGPCGLYRYKTIEERAVPFYINSVGAHPGECGMLLANLNLAEDRVLSYAAVVKTHEKAYTCYVPNAVFYFAAETTPLQLFQQRRRWINGTIAGYLWLLSNPGIIFSSGLRCINKPFVFFLLLCQSIMYLAMMLSPAIFTMSFYWSMQWIQNYLLSQNNNFLVTNMAEIVLLLYTIMYVVFVVKHSNVNLKPPVISWFVYLITVINAIAMVFITSSMFYGLIGIYEDRKDAWLSFTDINAFDVIIMLIVASLTGPPAVALLHSPTSFIYMALSIVQFYLFLPTMVIFIGAFSMSRVWDLSWGNRPSVESSLKSNLSVEERRQNGDNIKKKGKTIAYGVMGVNIFIVLIMSSLPKYINTFVIILGFFIFTWGIIQMVFSIVYFTLRLLRMTLRCLSKTYYVNLRGTKTKTEWYNA
jgi:cellulose synthase/poly-beta-1,6-N-acetylglucosamine synthase-like glycosyltransferase